MSLALAVCLFTLGGPLAGAPSLFGHSALWATVAAEAAVSTTQKTASVAETPGNGQVSVVLELDDPPVARVFYAARSAQAVAPAQLASITQAQLATVEDAQQQVLAALIPFHAQVLYRTQRVYNGIAVRVNRANLTQIRSLAGVKAVHPLIPKIPVNDGSVSHIGAPLLWQGKAVTHATGLGITIALIDTGIDYLHTDFGGPGTGYAENNHALTGDVPGFPGAKVIGGYDFAGDDYDADPTSATFQPNPHPDPDPMDCYGLGHGTHVAGIAAGYGVNQDGSTYRGPYSNSLDLNRFKIGPGVAPDAKIYALKVFGCSGSSDVVDAAIEWAVDPNQDGNFADHVDVINLSLGSTYGALDDPSTVAAENAALLGVAVVAAAGNAGDTFYTVDSPSVADQVISVASTAELTGQSDGAPPKPNTTPDTVSSFSARGPCRGDSGLKPDIAAPGQDIYSAGAGMGSGGYFSSGTSMATPHVAGVMALLRQLYPSLGVGSAGRGQQSWTVEDLKALVMNTASREIRVGPNHDFDLV